MLLYFNGDSFAAGVELADDMLPDYPGCFTWPLDHTYADPITRKAKNWLDDSHKGTHPSNKIRMSIVHEMTQTELARAYPGLVHKMTGIPCMNKSQGGSSMDRIVRVTIADLIRLKKEDPNRKLVAFICTTYIERSEIPNNLPPNLDMHGDPQDWASISSTFRQDDHDQMIENIRKYKVLFETQYHSMLNFYKNVVLLQDYCKLNDVELHWITAGENIRTTVDNSRKDRNDLKSLMDYANMRVTISMRDIIEKELVGQNTMCPGGHFAQPVHDRTAEKIVDILNKGKNNV
jgi:hypothetical protein